MTKAPNVFLTTLAFVVAILVLYFSWRYAWFGLDQYKCATLDDDCVAYRADDAWPKFLFILSVALLLTVLSVYALPGLTRAIENFTTTTTSD